jgi:glutamate carboxypeptidase
VELESYTRDKPGVDALADFLMGEFAARGAKAEILHEREAGNLLRAIWRSRAPAEPALILGHLDTVFPTGTVAQRPFRIEDGKAFGPGVFDMKSGIVVSLRAAILCRLLQFLE